MAAKMLCRRVDIPPRASSNDRGVFLIKISAFFGATLLMKTRPPGFSPKPGQGCKQARIFARAIQGKMKLLVELFNPQRIVFREELIVEPFGRPQDCGREQRGRLLQGSDLQNSPKFGKFSRLPFREDCYRQASIGTPHDQTAPEQPVQGQPDGLAADPETLGDQFLLENGAWCQFT